MRLPGLDGQERMAALMAGLRAAPPARIAGVAVRAVVDLAGADAEAQGLPRGDVLIYTLTDSSRVVVRPSGTEPKLKSYLEVRESVGVNEAMAEARGRAQPRMAALATWIETVIEEG